MLSLPEEVVRRIKDYLPGFYEFLRSEEGEKWLEERMQKLKVFPKMLSRDALEEFTEADFIRIMEMLWANQLWTNIHYPTERILSSIGGIDKLREQLLKLLWSDRPLSERYDNFRRTVKGMGPARITEILAYVNPDECGIWNRRSREGLKILGLERVIPVKKYDISGEEYERVNAVMKEIAALLEDEEVSSPNLLDVDLFLYYIAVKVGRGQVVVEVEEEFDHDEIKEMLLGIGQSLGFEVDSDAPIASRVKVDVVWRARIGNFGEVRYAFEVYKDENISSLLLSLIRAQSEPMVQKIIIVSDEERINRVQREADGLQLPKFIYWTVSDVRRVAELLSELREIMKKLELFKF